MIINVLNETPFQVLTGAFSIGPSETGYELQVGATPQDFATLFSVGANTTRMVTNVANGSYYRLKNNVGEVKVNWSRTCVTDGGGGGDMSNYYTKSETDAAIEEALSGITVDLSAYWTSAQTQSAITAVEDHLYDVERVTATALTELHDDVLELSARTVDLSGYYTSAQTDAAISAATAVINSAITDINADIVELSARTVPDMSLYSPTSGFSTINGSAITNGGNIVIEGGSAADPTTLKSVTELNPDAENGDVQSLYNVTSGLPADVSFVTGNTYGSGGNRFGGTLTILQSFGTDVADEPEPDSGEPVYLFNFDQDGYTFDVTATGDTYGDIELVITCDNYDVLTLSSFDVPGRYNFGHDGSTNTMSADFSIGANNEMIVNLYRYGGASTATDPTFNVPEASTEYGLYMKTENGWEEVSGGSVPDDIVTSSYISNIWKGTQAEYDAIVTKDPDTFYIIVSN